MKRYQKIVYSLMAVILLITILIIILIHSFNSTPESGIENQSSTTKGVIYGD